MLSKTGAMKLLLLAGMALYFLSSEILTSKICKVPAVWQPKAAISGESEPRIKVFSLASDHSRAHIQQTNSPSSDHFIKHVALHHGEQRTFLESVSHICDNGGGSKGDYIGKPKNATVSRFDELLQKGNPHLATLLWTFCELYVDGGLLLDSSPSLLLLVPFYKLLLLESLARNVSMGIINDAELFPNSLHASFLYLPQSRSPVSKGMLELLLNTPIQELQTSPLIIPLTLHKLARQELVDKVIRPGHCRGQTQNNNNITTSWYFFQQKCNLNPFRSVPDFKTNPSIASNESRVHYPCPRESIYCCFVLDPDNQNVVAMARHASSSFQQLPPLQQFAKPFNQSGYFHQDDLPYISTLRERSIPPTDHSSHTNQTNVYDVLAQTDCLPSDNCTGCLRTTEQLDSCKICFDHCTCYCKSICQVRVPTKRVSKEITLAPPKFRHDPNRIIPRIVHQTWFETVNASRYPHSSRLMQSFQKSGWDYRFYTDQEASNFLTTHFPPEVRQAYDDLLPGAFKADLFRYCVLLIHGGVYADIDILLESNLDLSIGPDVGFMAPVDVGVGTSLNRTMCIWNGFLVAAPGHPFLAKVIETVVNNARNRYTLVDYVYMFCPDPELHGLNAHDDLFTAGPCVLGASVNQVLGRPSNTKLEIGDLDPSTANVKLPGRTIILKDQKLDMGAHRFTHVEANTIIAATDLPGSWDRQNSAAHYSAAHYSSGVYGTKHVYANMERANEEIRIQIESP